MSVRHLVKLVMELARLVELESDAIRALRPLKAPVILGDPRSLRDYCMRAFTALSDAASSYEEAGMRALRVREELDRLKLPREELWRLRELLIKARGLADPEYYELEARYVRALAKLYFLMGWAAELYEQRSSREYAKIVEHARDLAGELGELEGRLKWIRLERALIAQAQPGQGDEELREPRATSWLSGEEDNDYECGDW